MFEIVGIGASLYDIIIEADYYPVEDKKHYTDTVICQCGGPTATGLVTASKLGATTTFLGIFSDDKYSKAMLNDFVNYNVDISNVIIKKGCTSGCAFVIVSKEGQTRTVIWTKGSLPSIMPDNISEQLIKEAKILYLDGNHLDASLYACKLAKENGVKILLDAGSNYRDIDKIVRFADLLIASEDFAIRYTGEKTVKASVLSLYKKYYPEVLVVTQGKKGGLYYQKGEIICYPSYPVPGVVVDTTGAGDVFHGAFAFSYIKGWSIEKCIKFSSAVAAIKCKKLGGRKGIPTYDIVENYMKQINSCN